MRIVSIRPAVRPHLLVAATIATLTCSLLSGCGGATKTVTVNGPPSGVAAASDTTGATGAAKRNAAQKTPKATVHLSSFQTPSGNVGCMVLDGIARCDIERRGWSAPPRPASCPNVVDYGQGLEVGASGRARFVCAGDTVREPKAPKLAYGDATEVGAFTCLSEENGLTCRARGGHGFFLSIQSYRVF